MQINKYYLLLIAISLFSLNSIIAQKADTQFLKFVNEPGCRSARQYHDILEENGWAVSQDADYLLGKITLWPDEGVDSNGRPIRRVTSCVTISVYDLGFHNGAVLDSIYQRASELKLFLCYGCTGPDLCLEYSAVRRRGTWAYNTTITEMEKPVLYFAMEPITNAAGEPQLFILESKWKAAKDGINASKGYLKTVAAYRTDDNGNDLLFDASDVFVFCTTEYIK